MKDFYLFRIHYSKLGLLNIFFIFLLIRWVAIKLWSICQWLLEIHFLSRVETTQNLVRGLFFGESCYFKTDIFCVFGSLINKHIS